LRHLPLKQALGQPMNAAGAWWLKGAWLDLGLGLALVSVIETARPRYRARTAVPSLRIGTHSREALVRKNETLVFQPVFANMTRPCHLDRYEDDGLGWLTEATQVYRAMTIERYLSDVTRLGIAAPLGQAFARCYWQAWYQPGHIPDAHVFYVDLHDKVIWTNKPSPVGFVSALREMHPCLKQTFIHGRGGQALFCQTYAADVHLSEVVVAVAQQLEQVIGRSILQVIVTDREGLSTEVIGTLAQKHKGFVTLLKANQYASEADFVRRGRFRHIKDSRTGQATHRVADADFQLAPDWVVRAALLYDLERPEHLIGLITTVSRSEEPAIRRVVGWYLARWNVQENSFRALIAFVRLDINFGLRAKQRVPDRRVAKQITDLTNHLRAVTHKQDTKIAQLAEQAHHLEKRTVHYEQHMAQFAQPTRSGAPPSTPQVVQRQHQLQELHQGYHHYLLKQVTRQAKLEREIEAHRQEQTHVTQELTQLNPHATFFEVDAEKDQVMAHLRIALHNSALWARDRYLSSAYRHATPLTLWRTFFNQSGYYRELSDRIVITLKPFGNSQVQREAVVACERFNERRIKTHSRKRIEMYVIESI
jgi:hypothetical protein